MKDIFISYINMEQWSVIYQPFLSDYDWPTDKQTLQTENEDSKLQFQKQYWSIEKLEYTYIYECESESVCVCEREREWEIESERERALSKKYQIIHVFFTINILVVEVSRGLPVPLMYLYL